MRVLSAAFVLAVTAVAVNATTGVALFDGSDNVIEENRPGDQRLLGLHHVALKDGVNPDDFERFIIEEWNPVMNGRIPGVDLMIVKGERNAKDGEYMIVYDVQSKNVRDWYWPSSDQSTPANDLVWERCGEVCSEVGAKFDSMAEVTNWSDYVEVARD